MGTKEVQNKKGEAKCLRRKAILNPAILAYLVQSQSLNWSALQMIQLKWSNERLSELATDTQF